MEADFLRHYGVDIAKLGCEELTYRRFGVLLRALPRESQFVQTVVGEQARWGPTEHLLAHVVDVVSSLNHNYVQAHRKTRLPKLKPFPRPGVEDAKPLVLGRGKGMSVAEMRRRLDARRGGS